jgi:hypothetical protein
MCGSRLLEMMDIGGDWKTACNCSQSTVSVGSAGKPFGTHADVMRVINIWNVV